MQNLQNNVNAGCQEIATSEIEREMNAMCMNLGELQSTLSVLDKRLEKVLLPSPPTAQGSLGAADTKAPFSCGSQMAARLHDMVEHARQSNQYVQAILDRLAL